MWSVLTVISYFLLALLLPVAWSVSQTWRRANQSRHVLCPGSGVPALVRLDARHAVRMHLLGENEAQLKDCTRWDAQCQCDRACLAQIGPLV